MKVDIINLEGEQVGSLDLPAKIFEAPIKKDLMHQAYVRQMANARLGTHKTKTRSEVAGGGRKPWRQKGTGRARHGSIRSPIWVGGGKAHAPQPRDYTKKMPKQMRRAALRSALSVKASEGALIVVESMTIDEPKTKTMAEILLKIAGDSSVLILITGSDDNDRKVQKAVNNLPDAKSLRADYLNIRDLLSFNKVVVPVKTIEMMESYLG